MAYSKEAQDILANCVEMKQAQAEAERSKRVGSVVLPPLCNPQSPNTTVHGREAAQPGPDGKAYWDF